MQNAINRSKVILIGLWLSALLSALFFTIGLYLYLSTDNTRREIKPRHPEQTTIESQRDNPPPPYAPLHEPDTLKEVELDSLIEEPSQYALEPSLVNTHEESFAEHSIGESKEKRIAIIIDDLGYQWKNGLLSLQLEGDFTFAILPFSPFGKRLANEANALGKEIIVHAPMEPENHHAWDRGLESDMDHQQVRAMLLEMLAEIPFAKGLNNHMGSALTQNPTIMTWVMNELTQRELYFIDSVTTAKSVAHSTAIAHEVPSLKRDVFIDNVREEVAMEEQLNKLLNRALKNGAAIGICHPYPETLAFLSQIGAKLQQKGIHLVPVSRLLSDGRLLSQND